MTIKIKQYLNIQWDMFNNKDLTDKEIIVYSFLADRMKSSRKRLDFYDDEQKAYYVVCPRDEWTKMRGYAPKTVTAIYHSLEAKGLIRLVKQAHCRTPKIFLASSGKIEQTFSWGHLTINKRPFGNTNHLTLNIFLGSTIYTVNTQGVNWHANKSQPITKTEIPESKPVPAMTYTTSPIELWKSGTASKMRIPENALDVIGDFVDGDVDQARAIVRTVSIARTFVAKEAGITGQPEARFESNQRFQNELSGKFRVLFGYIKQKGYTNYMGYLNKSLTTWFKDVMGLVADTPTVTKHASRKGHVIETIPDYMQDGYEPKPTPLAERKTNAEIEATNARFARFNVSHHMKLNDPETEMAILEARAQLETANQ